MSSARRDSFTFSFPIGSFNFNFCLMFLAGISHAMLNRSGKNIYFYLVPDPKEKADDKNNSLELSSRSRTILIMLLNALMQQDAGESENLMHANLTVICNFYYWVTPHLLRIQCFFMCCQIWLASILSKKTGCIFLFLWCYCLVLVSVHTAKKLGNDPFSFWRKS